MLIDEVCNEIVTDLKYSLLTKLVQANLKQNKCKHKVWWSVCQTLIPVHTYALKINIYSLRNLSIFVFIRYMYTWLCTMWWPGTHRRQKSTSDSWNWSYRELWATTWVQGIEHWSSARVTSALLCWAVSLASQTINAIPTTFVDIGVGILCVSEREVVLEWKSKGTMSFQHIRGSYVFSILAI